MGYNLIRRGLCKYAVSSSDYTTSKDKMTNELERICKEAVYRNICLDRLRKTTKYVSLGRDWNPGVPEYEAGVVTIQS
jgi:hypothetical protein